MNGTLKIVAVAVGAVLASNMVVNQFTDSADSETERLIWRVGSAAAAGVVLAKFL